MPDSAQFIFVCCQFGAEKTCKQELLTRYSGLRFAFSRPGFLTFKAVDAEIQPGSFQLESTFARIWGWSIGKAASADTQELAEAIAHQAATINSNIPFTMLHCWQRDTSVPGKNGFEPGISPVAKAAAEVLFNTLRKRLPDIQLNNISKTGEPTLCVVMVEPNEWWCGWHDASSLAQCWPGGTPPIELPPKTPSRAWLKIHEAVLWGRIPIQKGDVVAEIGCSPGGASQYLLEHGTRVIAIDPAAMDPTVAEHPRLIHVRRRARDVPRRDLLNVRWLAIDVNMPPSYTIEVVRDYVEVRGLAVRGIIATLKLPDWRLATEIDSYRRKFMDMGFPVVEMRQLAFNRQELCLIALRKRRHNKRLYS